MKRLCILLLVFIAIFLLVNSCQRPSNDLAVTLAVDPPTPTPNSTVTIALTSSLNMGVTLASISIDGVTVCSGDTVPLQYTWFPIEARSYVVEGYVKNIFGQEGRTQHVVNVLDNTPPVIKSLRVVPDFPESNSPAYLSIEVEEKESSILRANVTVANQTRSVQTIDQPIVVELPMLPAGQYPINVVVSSSDFARASTSTVLTIYPADNGEPTLELSLNKSIFPIGENVILNVTAGDDTELRSVVVELDGTERFRKEFSGTRSAEISVSLGEFNSAGLHSVVVTARDGRNKTRIRGTTFAVGTGPANVELVINPANPRPGQLVELAAVTDEVNVSNVTFIIQPAGQAPQVSTGPAFKYYWTAQPGRHVLSVMIQTEDGRVGLDTIVLEDAQPPSIDAFTIGKTQLKMYEYTSIASGVGYPIKINVSDDTAVQQGNTITVYITSTPFSTSTTSYNLVQVSISQDHRSAEYLGLIDLPTAGRFYLIPVNVNDAQGNTLVNVWFPIEVK